MQFKTPYVAKIVYPSLVWDMPSDENRIYLTFDDGPHPDITVSVLELLAKLNMKPERRWVEQLVLDGGPVAQDRGFVLYRSVEEFGTSVEVAENIHLSTAMETLTGIASGDGPENFLIALGYAGWSEGQLESEISRNSWLTVEATPEILFETPSEAKLQTAAKLLGIDFSLIAAQPGHG